MSQEAGDIEETWLNNCSCDCLGSCHLTWPELNHEKRNVKLSKLESYLTRIMDLKEEFDFEAMPTRYLSILNLKGFVLARLGQMFKAQKLFEKALSQDATNLCALGNLMNIYQLLGRKNSFEAKRKDYEDLCREKKALVMARYYNHKAHAIRYFQQDLRQFTYFRYAESSAHVGSKYCKDIPERAEWFFDYALALYRRYSIFSEESRQHSETANNVYERAVDCFNAIIHIEGSCRRLRALSWIFIGILLSYKGDGVNFTNPPLVYGPEECYQEALKLDGLHPYVTRRLGAECVKAGKYDQAEKYLDQSIEALPTGFAYRYRGLLFLKQAESTVTASKDKYNMLLLNAKINFEKTQLDYCADYSNLGYVLYLLEKHEEALSYFALAESGDHDYFFDLCRTYKRWSDCLRAIGENESAEEKQRQGKEIQRKIQSVCHLGVDSMFRFIDIVDESEYHQLKGSEYGVPAILVRDGDTPERFDYFIWYNHQSDIDRVFGLSLVKRLEEKAGLVGRLEKRDFLPGEAIPDEIVESVKICDSTIVIISSSLADSSWGHLVLCNALRCQRVVPIVLDDCEIPETLICYTHIRVHQNRQLSECDWKRLLKRLSQVKN